MKYFTIREAMENISETLDYFTGCGCDLHNETFNTDYYIIGTYEAQEALGEYGVFKAIREVQDYEESNFGKLYTEIGDPEKLANMLYYIIGEEAIAELLLNVEEFEDDWSKTLTDETKIAIREYISENY